MFTAISLGEPHILLLDEPTNHLDMQSIDALAEALQEVRPACLLTCSSYAQIAVGSCSTTDYASSCCLRCLLASPAGPAAAAMLLNSAGQPQMCSAPDALLLAAVRGRRHLHQPQHTAAQPRVRRR